MGRFTKIALISAAVLLIAGIIVRSKGNQQKKQKTTNYDKKRPVF